MDNQWKTDYVKEGRQCKKEFKTEKETQAFCGDECKQEALAALDSGSNECLPCQEGRKKWHH